jgi:hypothetical protein
MCPYSGAREVSLYAGGNGGGASAVWPSANLGIYVPFWLPGPFLLSSFFSNNGSAVVGNIDIGVYGPDGSLISSKGSTAAAGTNQLQILSLGTPVMLSPGRYYMAMAASSTSIQVIRRNPAVLGLQRMGVIQAASQVPLANLPTWATVANAYLPIFGIAQITTY